jgi:putative DNA primase/helicase
MQPLRNLFAQDWPSRGYYGAGSVNCPQSRGWQTGVAMTDIDRIREAVSFVPPADRDTWLRMGMAIKSDLGDPGFAVWDAWSQQADSYKPASARDVWRSIQAEGGITAASLFHEAKENGWRDDGSYRKATPDQLAERHLLAAERTEQEEAEIARERAATAAKAAAIWKAATAAGADHPYLARKCVAPVQTLREIGANDAAVILGYVPKSGGDGLSGRVLVVPVKQGDRLSTLELIDGDKRKAALAGRGTKVGGYWAAQSLGDDDGEGLTLLIGEGVATVLSARVACGQPGVAALSAGNILSVAKAMRERYPVADLVILADLVKATGAPDHQAVEAARSVGGKLAVPDFGPDRDPDMTDFNDMAVAFGAEAVKRAIASARMLEMSGPREDARVIVGRPVWPEPQPLTAQVEPEPYPIDALPNTVRAAVEEVAGFVKAPLALVASSALAALSLAIQAHVDAKRAERLQGPVGLFLLTIADSGERKSTCDGFFTKPILDYQKAQAEAAKPLLKDHRAAIEAWDAKRGGIKEHIRQLAKAGKPTDLAESTLRDLEHDKPEPPRTPRLLYTDATPEALAFALAKQWPSAGVVSAEAGIVFGSHGMSKDSAMRNLALLNQLWDGSSFAIDRRSTESFMVRGARLTVALQVQEPTLREFFNRSGALARGTGFLARFLVAWPESTQGFRWFTEAPATWPHLDFFHRRIAEILENPAPMDEDGALIPSLMRLAPEAKAAWIEYHNTIESELARGGELYDVRDVASKSADNAARMAALFQVFEHGMGGVVGLECLESASRIAAWHLHEARRFFGELVLPTDLADAGRLDSWLVEHCQRARMHSINKNYVRQHGPLRDGARLDVAIRELAELERLRLVKDGKRLTIQLNPALVEVAP